MRLWKHVDGEPYMINPRLGILALQALNPKGRKMAKHYGARHMAWVRSFRKKNKSHHKKHRKHNAYPMAGTVAALNPGHHKKRNPGGVAAFARGTLGLPPLMPVVYGASGFIATAATEGFVDTLVPVDWKTSYPLALKYAEIATSIVIVTWAAKHFFGGGASAFAAIGGGIFALQQAAHDFASGMIPGMHAYTPLKAYTRAQRAGASTMGATIESTGGEWPQLATRDGMPQLAAPDHGFKQSANFAADGGMNVVAERFRRF